MATNKLIEKLREYLDLEKRKQKQKRDKIRALLKKLKKRQRTLEVKLEETPDNKKRKRIQRELDVLHVQRRKGVKLCRKIGC